MARKKSGGRKKSVSRVKNERPNSPSRHRESKLELDGITAEPFRMVKVASPTTHAPEQVAQFLKQSAPEPWTIKTKGKREVSYDDYGYSNRMVDVIEILDPSNNYFELQFVDHPTHIELYSIFAETKGTGFGTKIFEAIKQYADNTNKGVLLTYVSNVKFVERFSWLRRRDLVVDDGLTFTDLGGWPEYVYGNVPENAMDYTWIFDVMEKER